MLGGLRVVIGRGPLHDRHMRRRLSQRRNQRRRRRARPDDGEALAFLDQIGGPFLGVNDRACKPLPPRVVGHVARLMVVISLTHPKELRRHLTPRAAFLHRQRPAPLRLGPVGGDQRDAIADMGGQPLLLHRLLKVGDDLRPGSEHLAHPRLPAEPERVEIAVRPDAGKPMRRPCPAQRRLLLDDREPFARQPFLQVPGGGDAGDPRADDQNVEMLHARLGGDFALRIHRDPPV